MKFTTTKEHLFEGLNETNKVIPIRTTLPILSCVLIKAQNNKITLIATDLEQTIISQIKGKILEEGETAIVSGRFFEIIAALPNEEIEIHTKQDQETEINSSKGIYKITGKDPGEYPDGRDAGEALPGPREGAPVAERSQVHHPAGAEGRDREILGGDRGRRHGCDRAGARQERKRKRLFQRI